MSAEVDYLQISIALSPITAAYEYGAISGAGQLFVIGRAGTRELMLKTLQIAAHG